eukprot:g18278.t1
METLPGFDWSEKERIDECMMLMMSDAEMQKLAACAESNSTECDTKSEGLKMPWPPEATAAMNSVLSFTSLLVPGRPRSSHGYSPRMSKPELM